MMPRYLVVYNTCEIRANNLFLYIKGLDLLLNQKTNGFTYDVVVSGCRLHSATKAALKKRYGNRIGYSIIDETYTVNITFNKTIDEVVKRRGKYDGYFFIDSGVLSIYDTALQEVHERAVTGKYGIISIQTDTDTGYQAWFNLPSGYVFKGKDFIVPVGKCIHIHFNYFSPQMYEYYGKVLPDIFKASCTESVFYYMAIALGQRWCVVKDIVVQHVHGADGPTCGFSKPPEKLYWNDLMCDIDITKALNNPKARQVGFGYDEWAHVFDHNPNAYHPDGTPKDPKGLAEFVKETVILPKYLFDYDQVKCEIIL